MSRIEHPKLYRIWVCMNYRCHSESKGNHYARNYKNRGIQVCIQWRNDYSCFEKWALSHGYSEGLTIDRIDPNGNYEPENCQWITRSENSKRASTNKQNGINFHEEESAILFKEIVQAISVMSFDELRLVSMRIKDVLFPDNTSDGEHKKSTGKLSANSAQASYGLYSAIRDEQGLRDSDVARMAGLTTSTMSSWKHGYYTPKLNKLMEIANVLNVEVTEIYTKGDNAIDTTLYKKIKAICAEKNMSLCKLEKAAHLGNGVIGKWRVSRPNISSVKSVANVLGVSASDLLGEE